MDETIRESLAGFDAVWQRVTGGAGDPALGPPPRPADTYSLEDTLLGFIHDETCSAVWAAALARLLPTDGRAVLQHIAAGARRHLRRLRAEHFIVTGVTGGGNEDCRSITGKLASLRALYLQADKMAGAYERACEQTPDPDLREAFAAFAADERRFAQQIRALLIESF